MNKRTWIWISLVAPLVLTLSGRPAAQNLDLGTEAQRQRGKVLYDKYCSQCHGIAGDGKGYGTSSMRPEPRDFTAAKFKIRTTPSGALPTDDDLRKVIREGMPYTTMIGWPTLGRQDVDNIIHYIKTFSPDFENPNYYEPPVAISRAPSFSSESAELGREVYVEMGCRRCHGDLGRTDGPSAPTLVNDTGQILLPADLTKRWTFRGGPTRQDIYRTFTTGLNGTPMPSYEDSLTDEQRWQLVDYVYSLGGADSPGYSEHVVSKNVEDDLDLSRGEALFDEASTAYFPLIGQIIEPGRAFHPAATGIEVRAVHNRQEVAFLLRWHDMRADVAGKNSPDLEAPEIGERVTDERAPEGMDEAGPVGESTPDDFWGAVEPEAEEGADDDFWGGAAVERGATDDVFSTDTGPEVSTIAESEFSDAVAIQLPFALPEGIRLPYFIFGDRENAVDIWFADLAQQSPQRFIGRGSRSLTPADSEDLEMSAAYEAGVWSVIFKRKRRLEGSMAVEDDQWYPVAFSVWDGWSEDRGNKRALTRWYYVYVEPPEIASPVMPMTRAALLTLGIEIVLIALVRRRYRNNRASQQAEGEFE